VSRFLHLLEDAALVSALVAMLALALAQIFLRNFFDFGILWAESFLRILVIWVAMLGAMVATRERNHISLDALTRYLPRMYVRFMGMFTGLVSFAVCGVVAWYALELVKFEYEDQTIAFGFVPNWICQSILPIGFAAMSIRFLYGAIRKIWVNEV
jgi:TRAP-type C4-dicarboxylate transport system permease small subunit